GNNRLWRSGKKSLYSTGMNVTEEPYIVGSLSPKPSYITLPRFDEPLPMLLDFLDQRFPRVGRDIWLERLHAGKITDEKNQVIDQTTSYRVQARLRYYREVAIEPRIPFRERILYQDEHIMLADKPHFLPVLPSGTAVNECLLHRLVNRTANKDLVPVHRLDRDTAGLVLFSKNKATRNHYFALFRDGQVDKQYEAVASLPSERDRHQWLVESRIEASGEWILCHNVAGEINARSHISMLQAGEKMARFVLSPITGKTHQLRLHMGLIGSQILHDPFYPQLLPKPDVVDYSRPLQLLAKRLSFTDPVTDIKHRFESNQCLSAWQV
ncbi:MAG: pseudouridine synthase, partial [Mariprofundus sp.]